MKNEMKRDVFEKALREWDDLVHSCGLQGEEAHGGCEFDPILIKYKKDYDAALPDNLPVIPKEIGEYIRWCKGEGGVSNVNDAMDYAHGDIASWIYNGSNSDTFARAWLDGYVVEGKHD
ncbi:DUF1642 domain-containing protein [Lactiplantibacillus plantarum]|uniref:DUF1642 domain-containing protein n=1 Tax=Lactiplantibacillus plantarum TaxID=1590 RepID=UPI002010A4DA|nr:DUF1642 domain-containing protein [Lactiplantibacillus plantarum]UQB60375.1 DUF1642 domain-containing protein [Lactiplantibacillus plantarum]